MLKKRRVVVTGLGAVSPIGNTIEEFWKALLEGKSGVKRLTCFDPTHFTTKIAAEVRNFDPSAYLSPKDMKRMDRFVQFAVCSANMAMADSGNHVNHYHGNIERRQNPKRLRPIE